MYLLQDKSADFSLVSSVGIKNNILTLLVLGVYEVCVVIVEFSFPFFLINFLFSLFMRFFVGVSHGKKGV